MDEEMNRKCEAVGHADVPYEEHTGLKLRCDELEKAIVELVLSFNREKEWHGSSLNELKDKLDEVTSDRDEYIKIFKNQWRLLSALTKIFKPQTDLLKDLMERCADGLTDNDRKALNDWIEEICK